LLAFGGFIGGYFARQALSLAADYERATVAFEVMTKSATVGASLLKDIQKLAIESPFQTSQLVQDAKQVMAFGFEVADVIPVLSRLGDVGVATGADMGRLILALGQVRTTGRLMGQELRQFTNAGVPILEYLAKVLGTTTQQVPNLVRQGKISFADVASAINMMTDSGGLFYGMMKRINEETVSGRWANFKESVQLTGMALGGAFFEAFQLKEVLTDLTANLQGVSNSQAFEFFAGLRLVLFSAWEIIKAIAKGIYELRVVLLAAAAAWVLVKLAIFAYTVAMLLATAATWTLIASWLIWIATIAAVASSLLIIIGLLDMAGVGDRLSAGFRGLGPIFQTAWKGIVDAIKGNDMELAFQIMLEALKIGWKTTLALLEIEWIRFSTKFDNSVDSSIVANVGGAYGRLAAARIVARDKNFDIKIDNVQFALENEQMAAQQKIADMSLRASIVSMFTKGTFGGRLSDAVYASALGPDGEGGFRGPNRTAAQYEILGGPKMGVGGMVVLSRQTDLFRKATDAILKVQMAIGSGATPEHIAGLESRAKDAIKQLEAFQDAIKGVGDAAAKIGTPLGVSAATLHVMQELEKKYEIGTTAMDRFKIGMSQMRESIGGRIGGIIGAGLIIAEKENQRKILANQLPVEQFGMFEQFKELQSSVGNNREKFTPAMMQGSREAQETALRSSQQSLTVEQQVLQTLQDANVIGQAGVDYQKLVVEALMKNPEKARAAGIVIPN